MPIATGSSLVISSFLLLLLGDLRSAPTNQLFEPHHRTEVATNLGNFTAELWPKSRHGLRLDQPLKKDDFAAEKSSIKVVCSF